MSGKLYLKDKLVDEELDLSMMQLTEIPVKEIEQLGSKVLKLNLSHNLLTCVPANLPLLTQLTSIDLSKNQIVELPENFGQLTKLKSLDLYSNQISKLPVSFAQLKSLKFLDLKENPLVPELAKAAGPCITANDCAKGFF
ncbi:leucine-rich repeat-containing protein 59 [Eurytemora carolleeae]|uniref:leucine-rich repeat-containing protein 59 n=1 Tax=Eurytemora carolleeae TaxID=1294199 RepID=UPI000C763B20|nr:leucine-rich repeat-containing protein 59 [Eurytemora carolleeae]|eukprot:XP_023327226.1 leucine-rich repeat-containing protein 59-like [Eurytemora affinis]